MAWIEDIAGRLRMEQKMFNGEVILLATHPCCFCDNRTSIRVKKDGSDKEWWICEDCSQKAELEMPFRAMLQSTEQPST